jgi:hypothetical protein
MNSNIKEELVKAYAELNTNDFKDEDKTPNEKYGKLPLEKLDTFTFKRGKQAGKSFLTVFENDIKYSKWVLNNSQNTKSTMLLFQNYLTRKLESLVTPEL